MARSGLVSGIRPTTLLSNRLFSAELVHRATIQHFVAGGTDDFGQPTGVWTDLTTDVHCRLQERPANETLWQFEGVTASYLMFMDEDVVVNETYRIVDVTDEDGVSYDAGPFDIVSCQRFDCEARHHFELYLNRAPRAGYGD